MADLVLYLTGAGASAEALPVVRDIGDELAHFGSAIKAASRPSLVPDDMEWERVRSDLLDEVVWVMDQSARHASVDTFARKLTLQNDANALIRLKRVLSCFFVYKQATTQADKRYDAFLASILGLDDTRRRIQLPANVQVLTWNYDLQWEKAFYGFVGSHEPVGEWFHAKPGFLHHLNGYCGAPATADWGGEAMNSALEGTENKRAMHATIKLFFDYCVQERWARIMTFAWESGAEQIVNSLRVGWDQVKTVVVIGYSFPFFNRDVDRLILQRTEEAGAFYCLQYPDGCHQPPMERMSALGVPEDRIRRISGTDLFFLPHDF
jgi:hypothetical protein